MLQQLKKIIIFFQIVFSLENFRVINKYQLFIVSLLITTMAIDQLLKTDLNFGFQFIRCKNIFKYSKILLVLIFLVYFFHKNGYYYEIAFFPFILTKKTYLIKNSENIKIVKRNMLTLGKILTGKEKEALAKILHIQKILLKEGPLTNEKILDISLKGTVISPSITQHVMTVMFPHYKMPISFISKNFPNISYTGLEKKSEIGWDQILSSCGLNQKNYNPFFRDGNLISLGNRENKILIPKTSQAYKNTYQEEPDFLYIMKDNNGQITWTRYYDWKTGNISANSGHIYGTSDSLIYENLSENLLKKQAKFYYFHNNVIGKFLDGLIKNSNMTWGQKNICFQRFLLENMHDLPDTINPSFIFKTQMFEQAEGHWNYKQYKLLESSLDISGFKDKITTEQTIAKALTLNEKTSKVIENYNSTPGKSTIIYDICSNIWKTYLH